MEMKNKLFTKDFTWGVATSSYQIEGAHNIDGKGASVWDVFSHMPGKVKNGDHGNIACDHYNKYKEDVQLLKNLSVSAYRFSVSWPRVIPTGFLKKPNMKGLDFYSRLIDELLQNDITPFLTLNHWDIPQGLEDIGGWPARDLIHHFSDFANLMSEKLGDRVKHWITHNEPWCTSYKGYIDGEFPPGIKNDYSKFFSTSHHLLLSHGMSIPIIRENSKNCQIGITLNLCPAEPASPSKEDKEATIEFDGRFNRMFLDPLYLGLYPKDIINGFLNNNLLNEKDLHIISNGDLNKIQTKTDFLGINYYSRAIIRSSKIKESDNEPKNVILGEKTDFDWEVHPKSFYNLLKRVDNDYKAQKIYITENGCSYNIGPNKVGEIDDENRIKFYESHLKYLSKAIQEGIPCKGYFGWSLMDNFEWAEGYGQRFGMTWVDFKTLKRTPKKSYKWYKKFIEENK